MDKIISNAGMISERSCFLMLSFERVHMQGQLKWTLGSIPKKATLVSARGFATPMEALKAGNTDNYYLIPWACSGSARGTECEIR